MNINGLSAQPVAHILKFISASHIHQLLKRHLNIIQIISEETHRHPPMIFNNDWFHLIVFAIHPLNSTSTILLPIQQSIFSRS